MGVEDIRIKLAFKEHRKRKKLNLVLGLQKSATDYLIDLWINTAQNNPDGVLNGMNDIDIAMEAGWEGDPEVFVMSIGPKPLGVGFLDKTESGVYKIHDWEEHQPWVFYSKERSKKARKAALVKWGYTEKEEDVETKTRAERIKEARKKGTHTEEEWLEMKSFFGVCVKCLGSSNLTKRDHIIPIYQGGSDGIQNIQPMCTDCNSKKGTDRTDYRISYCKANHSKMPAKWVQDAYNPHKLTPAKTNNSSAPVSAPLLSSPLPYHNLTNSNSISISLGENLYNIYIENINPKEKDKQRALANINHYLKEYSFEDLQQAIFNYMLLAKSRNREYRKNPANFFGRKVEKFFIDYLPENFIPDSTTEPEVSGLTLNNALEAEGFINE